MKDKADSNFSGVDILFGLLCFIIGLATMWIKLNPELQLTQSQLQEAKLRIEVMEKTLLLSK